MGINDVDHHVKYSSVQKNSLISKNLGSLLRLFLAIMVFVVFVLTIAK
jgi:hypothetical protein